MSANNEDHSKPGEAESRSRQSRPSAKKRSTAKTRRPSKAVDSEEREKDSKKAIATSGSDEQATSKQSANKQSTRRPAKKKSSSDQAQSDRPNSDEKSDKKPDGKNLKATEISDSTDRKQSARRPAKRKSDSNRRRSNSSSRSSSRGGRQQSRPKPTLRLPPLNPEELQAKAWDLYRADINEESTAMFNEDEAVDLVRRSFILADIFLRFRDQLFDGSSVAVDEKPSESSDAMSEE